MTTTWTEAHEIADNLPRPHVLTMDAALAVVRDCLPNDESTVLIDNVAEALLEIATTERDKPATVHALFAQLFPGTRVVIRGGADMPVDSTCGDACAIALRMAYAFANLPEVDSEAVAKLVADACETYING